MFSEAALRQAGACDKTHKAGVEMIWSQLSMLGLKKRKKKRWNWHHADFHRLKGKVPSTNLRWVHGWCQSYLHLVIVKISVTWPTFNHPFTSLTENNETVDYVFWFELHLKVNAKILREEKRRFSSFTVQYITHLFRLPPSPPSTKWINLWAAICHHCSAANTGLLEVITITWMEMMRMVCSIFLHSGCEQQRSD